MSWDSVVSNFGLIKEAKEVDGIREFPCACGKPVPCYQVPPCTNMLNPRTIAMAGKENFQSWTEIEDHLSANGGQIVNADTLDAFAIADARKKGHLFIDINGKGYVWRTVETPCGT